MKVLVTGATGFLGRCLMREIRSSGVDSLGIGKSDCDLTDLDATMTFVDRYSPTHVIHAAAYTNVAGAEIDYKAAHKINVEATENLVKAIKPDCHLTYISTDAVYSGQGPHHTTNAAPASQYGLTKYLGEIAAGRHSRTLILRTCFYGRTSTNRGLIEWLIMAATDGYEVTLYPNHIFSPLHVRTAAQNIWLLSHIHKTGIHNLGSLDRMSKLTFLCHAADILNLPTRNFCINGRQPPRDLSMDSTQTLTGSMPMILSDMRRNLTGPTC